MVHTTGVGWCQWEFFAWHLRNVKTFDDLFSEPWRPYEQTCRL